MKDLKQILVESLSPKQIKAIENGMRPGQNSQIGFLGENDNLVEVIQADAQVLKKYGITHKQIGDRLKSLTGQAERKWYLNSRAGIYSKPGEDPGVLIGDLFRVHGYGTLGIQECPFGNCGAGSSDYVIKNLKQKIQIKFPSLMPHLIRDHHFFEGNTSYRLDPEKAIEVLELKSGVDYTPKTKTEVYWDGGSWQWDLKKDLFGSQNLKKNAEKEKEIAPGVILYVVGEEGVIFANKPIKLKDSVSINGEKVFFYNDEIERGQTLIKRWEEEHIVG